MKNFEKYIDEIASDFAYGDITCPVATISCKCTDGGAECKDCFKRWALEEAKEEGAKNE